MTVIATSATTKPKVRHSIRKWSGVIWLLIEVNLFGGTIFGFPALFKILPQYGIYGDQRNCLLLTNTTTDTESSRQSTCEDQQTRQYQVFVLIKSILFLYVCMCPRL